MKKIIEVYHNLNKSIYVGERLKANLSALTMVSIASALLGLVLIPINIATHQTTMLIAAVLTFLAASACGITAGVLKKRELAGLIPILFCTVAFTYYTVSGVGEGSAVLWSLLMPIGVSYFVSVKYGLLLSAYYSIFFGVIFHSPLQHRLGAYYSQSFMDRFPLLFLSISLFTGIAMVQYHRMALFEIEHTNRLNEEVARQTRVATERADQLERLSEEIVETLARTIDAKDRYTNGHSFRVSEYSVALARKLGWPEQELWELKREGLLHDIGKIGVPDAVLNKPGRLTDEEFAIIKSHTTIGRTILNGLEGMHAAEEVAACHHERYDGRGYPEGLSGEQIPVHARVVAIADAFDAMHSDRIYRKGLPYEMIHRELVQGRGTQFDPEFLDVFLKMYEDGELP